MVENPMVVGLDDALEKLYASGSDTVAEDYALHMLLALSAGADVQLAYPCERRRLNYKLSDYVTECSSGDCRFILLAAIASALGGKHSDAGKLLADFANQVAEEYGSQWAEVIAAESEE